MYINIQYPVDLDVQVVLMPLENLRYVLYYENLLCSITDEIDNRSFIGENTWTIERDR